MTNDNRAARRLTKRVAKRLGLKAELAAPTQKPRQFMDPPTKDVPRVLFWWRRSFRVGAHIFTHCPRFFREWAGQDFRRVRSGTVRQAYRHTNGMCRWCLMQYELGHTV